MPPKNLPITGQGSKDCKKSSYEMGSRSPTGKPATGEDEKTSEMFDNPLYGSMGKSHGRGKDQDLPQKEHLTPPDTIFTPSKPADGEAERPPVPTPRNRSFTCSETKPPPPTPISLHPTTHKKPVVPSRSEGGVVNNRPPLPAKSRPGLPEPQTTKSRDYRESSELPGKHRLPARPGQPQPHKDTHPEVPKTGRSVK